MKKTFTFPDTLLPFMMITGAVTLYFSGILFTDKSFFIGDLFTQFYPWKDFAKNSLQSGTVPFWNPYVFSGVPFIADVQKGIMYPPGIVFLLFDFPIALKLYLVLHFVIAGFSAYILARSLGCSAAPAFAAALIFIFNSFFASKINNLAALGSASFLPAILYTFKIFIERKKATFFILGSALLALSFLAGHYRTYINNLLFCLLFGIYYISFYGKGFRITRLIKLFIFFGSALVMSLIITMPQSGLFFELFFNSAASVIPDYETLAVNSMELINLFTMSAPPHAGYASLSGWSGYSRGINIFLSATFFFLFIISAFRKKNHLFYFSFIVFVSALLLALGKNTPLHSFIVKFAPFLTEARFPGTALFLLMLPAGLIAANSFSVLSLPDAGGKFEKAFLKYFLYALLLTPPLLAIFNRQASASLGLDNARMIELVKASAFLLVMYALNFTLYTLFNKKLIRPAIYHALLIALIFSELYTFMSRTNPVTAQSLIFGPKHTPKTAELIRTSSYKYGHIQLPETGSVYRLNYVTRSEKNFKLSVPSSSGMTYGLYDAFGQNDLKLLNYTRFVNRLNRDDGYNSEIINLLNLKYIISPVELDGKKYEKIFNKNSIKVFKNEKAYPLFFVSQDIKIPRMLISQISWSRKNEHQFGNLKVNVTNSQEGWLIFCNSQYPGWTAYLDNMATKIEPAFGLYMGIKIPPGVHEILFNYTPENYTFYKILFSLIFIFCLVLGVVKLISLRK
ncbi:MAG: YfhO family protein [Candidatus Goldbacteria bacterium]|nr:YfhO family protein [Candidatus Goldiibacteriota bacterium]